MKNAYDIGDSFMVVGTFTHNGDLADPATVRAHITNPARETTVYTYGVDPELERRSEGVYAFPVSVTIPGDYYYRMDDNGASVATEGSFHARGSNIV